jgi:hypothetical protein
VVGSSNDNRIQFRVIQDGTQVLPTLRFSTAEVCNDLSPAFEKTAVHIAKIGQIDIIALGEPFGQVAATSPDAHDADLDPIIGPENPATAS